jgi:hemolysin III
MDAQLTPVSPQPDWHAIHAAREARMLHEERINTITHAAGCALGLAGVVALLSVVSRHGTRLQIGACVIYGVALVAVYLASTLSHAFHNTGLRRRFRMLDQACIFLLIAGTFTPPAITYLQTGMGWLVLVAMWCVALGGFVAKAFYAHKVEAVTVRLHLMLGWMPLLAIKPIVTLAPGGLLAWILAGGLCYTIGTIFLSRDHVPYFHAVWHLLVIAGSVCHFVAIWIYCTAMA